MAAPDHLGGRFWCSGTVWARARIAAFGEQRSAPLTTAPTVPAGFVLGDERDPAERHIGPFYVQRSGEGAALDCITGLITHDHHCNNQGTVHGGVLLTFADFTLCALGLTGTPDSGVVTVSLNCDFLRPARAGCWLTGSGQVTQRSGSLVFVSGVLTDQSTELLRFSGVGKRIRSD